MKIVPKPTFNNSPAVNAHQMEASPKRIGNKKANPIWNNKVRHKEIIAETAPLFAKLAMNKPSTTEYDLTPLIEDGASHSRTLMNSESMGYPRESLG